MSQASATDQSLRAEIAELRARLADAEEMLRAIRAGEVDALVVEGDRGPQLFTLQGLDAEQNRARGEMLAQVSDAVMAVNLDEQITFINVAAERHYGVRASDVLGRKLAEIVTRHWPSPEREAAAWVALREHGEWHGEYLQRTHDGREWPVDATLTALRDAQGTTIGHLTIVRDITERKRAEEAERESKANAEARTAELESLLAAAPLGMAYFDPQHHYVRINDELANVNGIPAAAHIGKTIEELLPKSAGAVTPVLDRIFETGEIVGDLEVTGETPSEPGVVRHWLTSFFPVRDERGDVALVGAWLTDISERKRAEDRLKRAIERNEIAQEAARATLYEFVPETDEVIRSDSFASVLGYAPDEIPATGRTYQSLMHPDDVPRAWDVIGKGIESGAGFTLEYRVKHKDGRYIWVYDRARVIRDEDGNVERVVGMLVDITERTLAEEAVRRRNAQLDLLARVSQLLVSNDLTEHETLTATFGEVAAAIGAELYFSYQPHDTVSMRLCNWGGLTEDERLLFETMRYGELLCGRVAARRQPIVIEDIAHTAHEGSEAVRAAGYGAYAGFPLLAGNRLLGTIAFITRAKTHFAEGEVQMIQTVCDQVVLMLERKRGDQARRQSQQRVLLASEAAQMGFWSWQPNDDSVVWENEYPYRILGVTPGSAPVNAARFAADFLHPDDLPVFEQAIARTVQAHEPFAFAGRIRRPDGETRWIEFTGTPEPAEDGRAPRIIGTVQDITARKVAEESLRASEEFNRSLMDGSADCVKVLDLDGRLLHMNAPGRCLMEIDDFGPLCGQEWSALWPAEARRDIERAVAAARGGDSYSFQAFCPTAKGTPRWWEVVVSPVRDAANGNVVRLLSVSRDITERKRAQEAVIESEARLSGILRRSPAGIVQADAAGRMTLVNPHWCEMLGYSEAEMLGRTVFDVTHPSSVEPTEQAVGRLAAGGPDFQIEKIYRRKDGSLLNAQSNVTALRSPTGEFLGLIAVVLDITERLRVEKELRETSHFLQRIAEVTPGVLQVFDLVEQRSVFINRTVESLLGYTPAEVQAMGAEVMSTFMHPQDLPRFEQHLARVCALADGEVADFEFRMRDRAGAWHWFHSHDAVFARDAAGAARQLIGVATEVTERKRAEEAIARLAAIVESSHDALFGEDLDGIITSWNPGAQQIFGYRADEIVGTSIMRLIPEARQDEEHALQRRLAAGERGGTFEAIRQAKDGRQFHAAITISPLKDAAGNVIGTSRVVRDISERKRSEEALARLAAIVESSVDAIVTKDLRGTITSWNAGAETVFGYSAEEIVGQSILRLIPPDRRDEEADILARVVRGEGVRHFETVRQHKDGREFPVSLTISPLKDAAGNVVGASKVVRDISERLRVEESLRQNAALFSALIAQAPMGTYVLDAQLRLLEANAEAMTAFAALQPVKGRPFDEITEFLWGPEVGAQISGIFRRTLETGARYVSPPFTKVRHDLGIEQSYEWETQRITLPDGQYGVVCYFHEVTERAHAVAALQAGAERLRLAAETTGIGVWEWHLRTNRIKWDAQMFRLYGMPPTTDGYVDYADWSGAVLPEELAANEAILQETVRQCGQSRRAFRIQRRDDGACRNIEAVDTVRTNAAGEAEWVLGTNLDVTARRQTEDELRRLAADLALVDRRKDAFLATLSHELRNPLAAIRTGIHLLRLTTDPVKTEQNWARIERQVAMLVRLLDDLMDVSRISQDKLALQTQRVDLASIVHRALETSQSVLEARGHTVTVTLPAQPIAIDGDATRLVQVFGNLLTNAAKYSDGGSPIRLTVQSDGRVAETRVQDYGIGIASAELPRLFEMFGQIDSARDRAQGGLGIGLHLVKRLVEMHGGSVEARSEGLGRGSEFVVRLPLASNALPDVTRDAEPQPEATLPSRTRALRVLVADDNEDAASTLADLITQMGHAPRVAHDGAEAVALAARMSPDVALLDIGMPELRGDEAASRIRVQPGGDHVVLIAVTGWGQDEDRARSSAAGFDHHLVKPVDPVALAALLRRLTFASTSPERASGTAAPQGSGQHGNAAAPSGQ